MEQSINVNFQNLTEEERETLLKLCEKSQKKEVKKGLWKPDEGERCFSITIVGEIIHDTWRNFDMNKWDLIDNNCFKTKEEAEFELEKRKVLYELRKFAVENNTEKIDWNDLTQEKNCFYYSYKDKKIYIDTTWFFEQLNNIYFTSRYICYKAIEEIGEDRIKKYLFNVEE